MTDQTAGRERYTTLYDAVRRCMDHLAVLVASLEAVGDEELYEHAMAAYAASAELRAAFSRRAGT